MFLCTLGLKACQPWTMLPRSTCFLFQPQPLKVIIPDLCGYLSITKSTYATTSTKVPISHRVNCNLACPVQCFQEALHMILHYFSLLSASDSTNDLDALWDALLPPCCNHWTPLLNSHSCFEMIKSRLTGVLSYFILPLHFNDFSFQIWSFAIKFVEI